ncbi:MAG TPA: hypothetical protein VG944_08535 [Fimbriimonas sp.]|nr:hypothetical protein [Fimbriimonas sp.]
MYVVASLWSITPGQEEEFVARGGKIADLLRQTGGITSFLGFRTDDGHGMAVVGYESKEAYDRIVTDPNGPFAKAAAEYKIEEVGEWIQSWRGEQTH